jgi:hypothetical protein
MLGTEVDVQLDEVSVYAGREQELQHVSAEHPLPGVLDDGVAEPKRRATDGKLAYQATRDGRASSTVDDRDHDDLRGCVRRQGMSVVQGSPGDAPRARRVVAHAVGAWGTFTAAPVVAVCQPD